MALERAKRYTHYSGTGCWPERSAVYNAHCCGNSDSMPTKYQLQFNQARDQLGDETSAWLRTYTLNAPALYKETNKALKDNDANSLPQIGGYVYKLKRAIKDRYKSIGRTRGLVFRGCGIPKKHLYLYTLVGRKFIMPCFWSTSKRRSKAEEFVDLALGDQPDKVGVIFVIDCDSEVGLSYFVDITECSVPQFKDERETLFFPYSGFQITAAKKEDGRQVVYLKPYDQQLYMQCALQRVEWCRFSFEDGHKRIPLAQCFYMDGGDTKSAMSCARVREYASGGTTWAKRNAPGDLAAWVSTAWKEEKNVCFVGSGADGAWSGFAVTGFGGQQSYNYGSDLDGIKDWIEDKWTEGMKITSWAVQDGQHFVVMTKNASLGGLFDGVQKWKLCGKWSDFREYYRDAFTNGFCITSLCFDRSTKKYIVVMTKASNSQSVTIDADFPAEWVRKKWAERKTITQVLYDTDASNPWFVVATGGIGDCNQWSTGLRT